GTSTPYRQDIPTIPGVIHKNPRKFLSYPQGVDNSRRTCVFAFPLFLDRPVHLLPITPHTESRAQCEHADTRPHQDRHQPGHRREQTREVVAHQPQRRYPQQPANARAGKETTLTHPGCSRDQRSERTHPRNPPCRHNRQETPAIQERSCPLEVVAVEYLPTPTSNDFRSRVTPDVVTHLIPENRDDQRGPAHQPRLDFRFVRRQHHAGTEQQRVTGQEQTHDERALTENEAEYDDPHEHRTGGLEPTRVDTVRRCCVHTSHTLNLPSRDTSSSVTGAAIGRDD